VITQRLIESEIADFFAGFGSPGEPSIQSGEAQNLLIQRLTPIIAEMSRRVDEAESLAMMLTQFGGVEDYVAEIAKLRSQLSALNGRGSIESFHGGDHE
jgi:hypothetical protein